MLVFAMKAGLGRCVSTTLAMLWEKIALEKELAWRWVMRMQPVSAKMASPAMTVRRAVMMFVMEAMEVALPILRVLCVTVATRVADAATSVRARSIRMPGSALTNRCQRYHARVETRTTVS